MSNRADLIWEYHLAEFYNPFCGNLIITDRDYTEDVAKRVRKFLKENQEWVLEYEDMDNTSGYFYLNTLEDLKNW